ncbi:DNA-binding protein [Corynebacterium sp. CCUG 71335]|nr:MULTISPECIES: Rv2175c family DNA-binding protein [unclassified Corynebacterium]MCQ4617830.1 DNA-binding protein [Corynebacterium pseudogenitalium]MCQ4620760.1 DNA-binding protein [Corynebacterium sp. CCUG 71335]MCQ4622724.1 DNA-binding protein [Corynebacterium sp. CCUG 70398]MCQ4626597.1 DNA-binding protein [Corynebacterium sp. CCUG 65737]
MAYKYGRRGWGSASSARTVKSVSDIEYDLDTLLEGETLLSFPEVADRLGVPVTKVHDYVGAGKLVAHKADGVKYIPEALLSGDELSKFVGGAITVLLDGGYRPDEILAYLFTDDDSLPGRPIDALHGHGAREVIRRAQAMAF